MAELLLAGIGIPMDLHALIQYGWGLGENVCTTTGTIVTTSGRETLKSHKIYLLFVVNIN